jgi:hypothetical protein
LSNCRNLNLRPEIFFNGAPHYPTSLRFISIEDFLKFDSKLSEPSFVWSGFLEDGIDYPDEKLEEHVETPPITVYRKKKILGLLREVSQRSSKGTLCSLVVYMAAKQTDFPRFTPSPLWSLYSLTGVCGRKLLSQRAMIQGTVFEGNRSQRRVR